MLYYLELTTVSNDDFFARATRIGAKTFDLLKDVHTLLNLAKNDVLTIQPAGNGGGNEELGTVGVGSSVSHAQQTGFGVLKLEVLIGKLFTVD